MDKKFNKSFLLIGLTVLIAACQPEQSTASSPSIEPTIAPTLTFEAPISMPPTAPAPTLAPTRSPDSNYNISFDIPLELSASASSSLSTDAEFPYIYPEDSMPEHRVFRFTNYPVQVPRDARIMVFKASDYASYSELLQQAVTALSAGQDMLQPLPDSLVQGEFYAQGKPIPFKNGHGVRYLTQVLIDFGAINNEGLFYYYQGISADGAYFISAIFPVIAEFLPANGLPDAVTPPEGVPFDWQGSYLDFPPYLSAVTQKLNDTPAERYTPSLLTLDRLIESIQVSGP